jgi:RNA polymerase sigma factor (sigma-70 family)
MISQVRSLLGGEAPSRSWPDEKLVQACLAGDQSAWEALIDKYKRLVYSIPFRYGATGDDAADIFQAVCIDLYNGLPTLRRLESLRSWLITVTRRHSLRWKRGLSPLDDSELDMDLQADPAAPGGPEWVTQMERHQLVGEAIQRLSDRCKTLLHRLFFDDPPRPYDEVARELGLAVGSIGFNRGRCLDKLRKELEDLGL